MNRENIYDKEELRSVRTTNEKLGRVAPLVLLREVMATVVTWLGLGEVDKRGRPRVPTHHPLVFQNQQA